MKKMLLFAAAATITLCSCVENDTVYTGEQTEIALKAVSHSSTKAPISDVFIPAGKPMGVFATYNNASTSFANAKFETEDNSASAIWAGNPPQYWPSTGVLDFAAYYPHYENGVSGSTTEISIEGIDNQTAQDDILYSNLVDEASCETKPTSPLIFNHALSQIVVTVASTVADNPATTNDDITVTSVKFASLNFDGDLTITPNTTKSVIAWSNVTPTANFELLAAPLDISTTPANAHSGLLVMPGTPSNITIVYTLGTQEVSHELTVPATEPWKSGFKYTYNISIGIKQIDFTTQVTPWEDGGNTPLN